MSTIKKMKNIFLSIINLENDDVVFQEDEKKEKDEKEEISWNYIFSMQKRSKLMMENTKNIQANLRLQLEVCTLQNELKKLKKNGIENYKKKCIQKNIKIEKLSNKINKLENDKKECIQKNINLSSQIEELEDKHKCISCYENDVSVLFTPCNHLCLCKECSKEYKEECPICRKKCDNKINVFFS